MRLFSFPPLDDYLNPEEVTQSLVDVVPCCCAGIHSPSSPVDRSAKADRDIPALQPAIRPSNGSLHCCELMSVQPQSVD
jgi:hypothetical protein